MEKRISLQAACLAAGLATAWGPAAHAENFNSRVRIQSDISVDLAYGHLMLGHSFISGGNDLPLTRIILPPGPSTQTIDITATAAELGNSFVLMGLASAGGDVAFTFGNSIGALDMPFETVFPGQNEATLRIQILNNDPAANIFLFNHFLQLQQFYGQPALGLHFSNGTPIGLITVLVTPIPEPALISLGAFGAFFLLVRRR